MSDQIIEEPVVEEVVVEEVVVEEVIDEEPIDEEVVVEEPVVEERNITFTKLNDTLCIPLLNGEQFNLEFECNARSGVIESYNNLIMYINLNTPIKDDIQSIEQEIKENYGDENGDFKSSILKNTNVGIYKLYKKKDKLCAEIKTKANRNMMYSKIKSLKKYKVKLVLDYLWKKDSNYGYSWNIHKIQEI